MFKTKISESLSRSLAFLYRNFEKKYIDYITERIYSWWSTNIVREVGPSGSGRNK
jgi:hypothetical protein